MFSRGGGKGGGDKGFKKHQKLKHKKVTNQASPISEWSYWLDHGRGDPSLNLGKGWQIWLKPYCLQHVVINTHELSITISKHKD